MTEVQKLQNEINEMNAKRKAVIRENTVKCENVSTRKSFTYKDSSKF